MSSKIEHYSSIEILELKNEESSGRFEGYNLFVVERHDSVTWENLNRTLVISDLEGNIYFTKELVKEGNLADLAAEFINSTTILYGDEDGAHLWNIETDFVQFLNFSGHHDYERNYANNTYFGLAGENIEAGGDNYIFDRVIEYTTDGSEVWYVNSSNFVDYTQLCPYEDLVGPYRDVTHSNTIFFDEKEDIIYLNSRNVNTFYKIDHKTGDLIWSLGEYGNFTLFDLNGQERDILFYHTHALEKIDDNRFLLFDNDEHNQTNSLNHRSRLLEITIDEDKMFANVSWEWIAPEEYFCSWWGDCDRLPNNNTLGVFGSNGRLVEVNIDGEIVWEYLFQKTGSDVFGIYRVERIHFEPIVSTPRFINFGENDSYVEWDVWYNFRSKTVFQGEYFISIDGELVDNDTISFPRFWHSEKVRYNITELELGEHEISLVVADEAGHFSNETDRYSPIGTFSYEPIRRTGLIIGLSVGLGVPTFIAIVIFVWYKYVFKKPIFRKKKQ